MSKSLKKLIDIDRLREFKSKLNAQNGFESWPVGVIIPFAGTSVPTGYLLCNGAAVSRTTYASLFAAIGTLYGTGDGSTTFALPDYRGRVLQGADDSHAAGTYIAAGLPNITGSIKQFARSAVIAKLGGAFYEAQDRTGCAQQDPHGGAFIQTVYFNASRASTIYGASSTVQPQASAIQYLIKY